VTKSELIEILACKRSDIPYRDVEQAVKTMLEQMSESLAGGDRIEIRGFGSFSLHFRPPRVGRNPKTGDAVALTGKYVPISSLVRNCVSGSTIVATMAVGNGLDSSICPADCLWSCAGQKPTIVGFLLG